MYISYLVCSTCIIIPTSMYRTYVVRTILVCTSSYPLYLRDNTSHKSTKRLQNVRTYSSFWAKNEKARRRRLVPRKKNALSASFYSLVSLAVVCFAFFSPFPSSSSLVLPSFVTTRTSNTRNNNKGARDCFSIIFSSMWECWIVVRVLYWIAVHTYYKADTYFCIVG